MRPICVLFLLLTTFCCTAAAEEHLQTAHSQDSQRFFDELGTQVHPHASLLFGCDYRTLLAKAAHAKPSSIWWSADAAEQRAAITKNIDLMNRINSDDAPLFSVLETARGFLCAGYTSHLATGIPEMLFIADMGGAAEELRTWINKQFTHNQRGLEAQARGFAGFVERHRRDSFFVGTNKDLLLYGYAQRCENNFGLGLQQTELSAPLFMDISIKQILRDMAFLAKHKRDNFGFQKWGEITRGIEPQLRIEIDIQEQPRDKDAPAPEAGADTHAWQSSMQLSNFGSYDFKAVSQRIRSCVPRGSQIWSLLHLDVERISSRFISALSEQELHGINNLLGFSLQQLPSVLSGDLMLAGRAGFGLPEAVLSLQVSNPAAVEQALETVMPLLRGSQRISTEHARVAWSVKLPSSLPQVIAIGLSDDLLVICNNQFHLSEFLTTRDALDTSSVTDESFFLSIDLAQLAKTFLPLAWAFLSTTEEALSTPIVQRLYWPLNDALMESIQADDRASAINDVLSAWQRQSLALVFPDQDIGKCCAESFGLWAEELDGNPLIICRSKAGYHRISHKDNTLTREQVEKLTQRNIHRAGPQLDDLPILDIPETPYFNKQWLPRIETIIKHLPPYEARMSSGKVGSASLHERGLPLCALGSGVFLGALWLEISQLKSRVFRNRERQRLNE